MNNQGSAQAATFGGRTFSAQKVDARVQICVAVKLIYWLFLNEVMASASECTLSAKIRATNSVKAKRLNIVKGCLAGLSQEKVRERFLSTGPQLLF